MNAPAPKHRATTPWIWMLFTAILIVVTVLVGLVVLNAVFTGEIKMSGRNPSKVLYKFSVNPVDFLRTLGGWLLVFGALCCFCWVRIDIWRNRHNEPIGLHRKSAGIDKSTSKTGNKLALILAVPFIFIVLLVVYAFGTGLR